MVTVCTLEAALILDVHICLNSVLPCLTTSSLLQVRLIDLSLVLTVQVNQKHKCFSSLPTVRTLLLLLVEAVRLTVALSILKLLSSNVGV